MTRRGTPFAGGALIFLLALGAVFAPSSRSGNGGGRVEYPRWKATPNGRILEAIVTGNNATPQPGGAVDLETFELRAFRNGQTNDLQFTAQGPHCRVDVNKGIAGDPGPVQIFTPTTKLYVQGTGFFCADSNQVLVLSNAVETRVVKSLLRAPFLPAPKTNTPEEAGQLLKIFADHGQFDYRSNLVNYAGHVRAEDPQMQMQSPFLSVLFNKDESVREVHTWDHVTATLTNKGTATGDTGAYFDTNGTQILELAGHAEWHNGDQEAFAQKFTYDPDRHFLIADEAVHVRWPNQVTNLAAPTLFRELYADHSTLQMSPDGQLVDAMFSEGNVIIVNQVDQSRTMGRQATYNRTNDLFEITTDAHWWNDDMEVWADTLSVAPTNQVYHARHHARLKRRLAAAGGSGAKSTNQWLEVTSDEIDSRTNLVTFRGTVEARILDGDQVRDTLHSKLLLVTLDSSNQLQTVAARGDVHAETAADASGVKKTIVCQELTARFWPGGKLLRTVIATNQAVMEDDGAGSLAISNKITADRVAANFSSVTNQMEDALAEGSVDFHQSKAGKAIHATGDRGYYHLAPVEQVEMTGHPWAQNDDHAVTGADRLQLSVKSGELKVFGRYHIAPSTNALQRQAKLTEPSPAP
jgi:lipopolysaccharide export system protein LptA